MSRLKITFTWLVFLLFAVSASYGQTFQDFKKGIREEFDSFEKETQDKFNGFVDEIDKEFSEYLLQSFGNYDVMGELHSPPSPKPDVLPLADEIIVGGDLIEYKLKKTVKNYQGPVYPNIKKDDNSKFTEKEINIDFLAWPLAFKIDESFTKVRSGATNETDISNYWTELSKTNYNHFLFQLSQVANELNLNQWAYYQLLKECSFKVYLDNNSRVLFQWAMLSRSRYKCRLGFNDDAYYLLLPTVYEMYDVDYINIDGLKYYIMDAKPSNIKTYAKDFPEADILMDVSIKKPFYTNPIKKSKDFHFVFEGEQLSAKLKFDEAMISFYESIPLSDVSVYFNSVISDRSNESVIDAFEPLLKGRSEEESAQLLLSFVQQAFDYKTDQQSFGHEKYFFADEILHYPYADCEDRSIFYVYLIKTLLKSEVIAVSYPGHMATAISFNSDVKGDYFSYNSTNYIVADPTFVGSPLGVLMPGFIGEKAVLIPLNSDSRNSDFISRVWELTNNYGGYKADNMNDVLFDDLNNIYVCGYFVGNANFDGIKLIANSNERDVFVAKYDKQLNLIWVKAAMGEGNDVALSICLNNNDLYVYGSFESDLNFGNKNILAIDAPDVFIANYDIDGNIKWAKKAGVDKIDHSLDFMFAAGFSPQGEKIMAKLYSSDEDFDHYGIEIDDKSNIIIKGSFYATNGMSSNDYINFNELLPNLDIPKTLNSQDTYLKQKEYESTISGLFAALSVLNSNSIKIKGSQLEETFTLHNKKKIQESEIYTKLISLNFAVNEKGIVTISTANGQAMLIEMMQIDDKSKIRIIKYKSGNMMIEVLSGIKIVKGDRNWSMNSINLYRDSGDLLFSFGENDIKKRMNLNKEILKR